MPAFRGKAEKLPAFRGKAEKLPAFGPMDPKADSFWSRLEKLPALGVQAGKLPRELLLRTRRDVGPSGARQTVHRASGLPDDYKGRERSHGGESWRGDARGVSSGCPTPAHRRPPADGDESAPSIVVGDRLRREEPSNWSWDWKDSGSLTAEAPRGSQDDDDASDDE